MSGWIKSHRKILDWQWVTSGNHLKLFVQILHRANYKVTKWRNETIEPGQLLTGRKQLSQWSGLSERQVRTVLFDLQKSQEVTIKSTTQYSVITIVKWKDYQGDDQETTSDRSNEGPTDVQQTTTSKKANKGKKLNNTLQIVDPSEETILDLLNTMTSSNFKQVESNHKLIRSKLREGYTEEDFRRVIEAKVKDWAHQSKWKKFLRPSTLFGPKFDEYLNEAIGSETISQAEEDSLINSLFAGA